MKGQNLFNNHTYFLRSWVDKKTFAVKHQLYVRLVYHGEWEFFMLATSQDAEPLEFTSIDREVISCAGRGPCLHAEQFGVDLDDAVLKAHRDGYSVKFRAKSGSEFIITLSPEQIEAQLDAVESYIAQHRPGGR